MSSRSTEVPRGRRRFHGARHVALLLREVSLYARVHDARWLPRLVLALLALWAFVVVAQASAPYIYTVF